MFGRYIYIYIIRWANLSLSRHFTNKPGLESSERKQGGGRVKERERERKRERERYREKEKEIISTGTNARAHSRERFIKFAERSVTSCQTTLNYSN